MEQSSSGVTKPEGSPSASPHRRRRSLLTVSLRAMMVLVLLVALWAAGQVNRARTIRRAVATIEEVHNTVLFDLPLDDSGRWKSRLHPPRWLYDSLGKEYFAEVKAVRIWALYVHSLDQEVIRAIASIPGLRRVELHDTYHDSDLERLSALTDLEEVVIQGRLRMSTFDEGEQGKDEIWPDDLKRHEPSAAGLRYLSRMRKLRRVELGDALWVDASVLDVLATLPDLRALRIRSWIGQDDEVLALGKFHRLQELEIWGTSRRPGQEERPPLPIESWGELRSLSIASFGLTPDEVRAIVRLPNLETLRFINMSISNASLSLLAEMKGLKRLGLDLRFRSQQEVDAYKAALPNVSIELTKP